MKKLSVVYIAAVLSLCTLPLLLTPIWGEKSSAEKRDLAEFPALIEDGAVNPAFSEELDGWITDHFAFRSELITANNLLKAKLFHSSDEDQVIVGKNGWLYFAETGRRLSGTESSVRGGYPPFGNNVGPDGGLCKSARRPGWFLPSPPTKIPFIQKICRSITGKRQRKPIWTDSPIS